MSRLNMEFNEWEDKMIEELKFNFGFHETTELMHYLLKQTAKKLEHPATCIFCGHNRDLGSDACNCVDELMN